MGTPLFPKRGKGRKLHFINMTYDRKGRYTCVARNAVGMASVDVKIIFKGKEAIHIGYSFEYKLVEVTKRYRSVNNEVQFRTVTH